MIHYVEEDLLEKVNEGEFHYRSLPRKDFLLKVIKCRCKKLSSSSQYIRWSLPQNPLAEYDCITIHCLV